MITRVRIKFDKLVGETKRAYLLRFGNEEIWFPIKMCRNFITNRKLGGNMVVPVWLYKEKFGHDPNESEIHTGRLTTEKFIHSHTCYEEETIIERHKPDRIEPIESNIINDLRYGTAS